MTIGIITGTGTYALPELDVVGTDQVESPVGTALLTRGILAGVEVVHISRHGERHMRLSNHVEHRANVLALHRAGVSAVLACTACGVVDRAVPLGAVIVFDDLYFPSNRLPDGSLCTLYSQPGDPLRGHWIHEMPFSEPLRRALVNSAGEAGQTVRDGGCYGHVDGPRFDTAAEIRALALAGVTAVSQTAGPEAVLCGEAELPYALIGFATDYANAVADEATPVQELIRLVGESTQVFASVLERALPKIDAAQIDPTGVVYRFE